MKKIVINNKEIKVSLEMEELIEFLQDVIDTHKLYALDFEEGFNSKDGSYIICTGNEEQANFLFEQLEQI